METVCSFTHKGFTVSVERRDHYNDSRYSGDFFVRWTENATGRTESWPVASGGDKAEAEARASFRKTCADVVENLKARA